MRVIMHKAEEESAESIKIIQEHNWVINFLKNRIITIEKVSASSDPDKYEQARNDLNEFVSNLRKTLQRRRGYSFSSSTKS